jgi:Family of unknown function (DUF5937)
MRGLRPGLRREIAALSFLYRWTLPNCLLPSAATGYEDFEAELARLRALKVDVAAFELLRTIYDHGGTQRARRRVLADPAVRRRAVASARRLGREARRAAALLLDDPAAFVERLAALLEAYWDEAFAEEWQRVEPKLAAGVAAAGRQIAGDGVYRFLLGLAPQLRVEPGGRRFGLDVPHDHDARSSASARLELRSTCGCWRPPACSRRTARATTSSTGSRRRGWRRCRTSCSTSSRREIGALRGPLSYVWEGRRRSERSSPP